MKRVDSLTTNWPISIDTNTIAHQSVLLMPSSKFIVLSIHSLIPRDSNTVAHWCHGSCAKEETRKKSMLHPFFHPALLLHPRHWRKWENSFRVSLSIVLLKIYELIIHCVTFYPSNSSNLSAVRMKIAFIIGLRLLSMFSRVIVLSEPIRMSEWGKKENLARVPLPSNFSLNKRKLKCFPCWLAVFDGDARIKPFSCDLTDERT